jgi:hypothetical protein
MSEENKWFMWYWLAGFATATGIFLIYIGFKY